MHDPLPCVRERCPAAKTAVVILVILTGLFFPGGDACPGTVPAVIDTARFIEGACISYTKAFTLEVPLSVWEGVIEHPYLLGRLWERYGFEPPYQITRRESVLHFIDPTGLEADLFHVGSDASTRVFCGDGSMKNWGLPIGVRGRVLFILTYTGGEQSVGVDLRLFGEGTGTMTDIIIKMCSPILKYYINRRITGNLRDANVMLADIASRPADIRDMLDSGLWDEFDTMLAGPGHTTRK